MLRGLPFGPELQSYWDKRNIPFQNGDDGIKPMPRPLSVIPKTWPRQAEADQGHIHL